MQEYTYTDFINTLGDTGYWFRFYELRTFLRQNEFSDKVRNYFFANGFCENCGKKCYNQYREYWYINGRLLVTGCKKNETAADYIGIID